MNTARPIYVYKDETGDWPFFIITCMSDCVLMSFIL